MTSDQLYYAKNRELIRAKRREKYQLDKSLRLEERAKLAGRFHGPRYAA